MSVPDFASAISVYSDSSLLTLAPDGFYSDGIISRQQVGGFLLTSVACSSTCPCVTYEAVAGGTGGVVYYTDCIGASTFTNVLAGETIDFCAKEGSITSITGGVTVSLISTSCIL